MQEDQRNMDAGMNLIKDQRSLNESKSCGKTQRNAGLNRARDHAFPTNKRCTNR